MSTICTLKNLSLTYPLKTIFKEVSFTLNEGDKIGVLGLNGHGKSSLFKVLTELVTPDTSIPPFIFDKSKDFSIFLVPQELPVYPGVVLEDYLYEFHPEFKKLKLKLKEVEEKLNEGGDFEKLIEQQGKLYDKLAELGEDQVYNQYISYLKFFGLEDHQVTVESFSGGELRKVALALGLSAPQKIILWDEPTNHLDLETIELFEDEIRSSNKTYMIISHDRSLLNNVVDHIVHIQRGDLLKFTGTYEDYLNYLQEEQKRREKEIDRLSNKHRRETAWIRRGVSARRTKSKKRIEDYSSLSKEITHLKAQAHKKASLSMKATGRKTKVLLSAEDLSLSFNDKCLFKNLEFEIVKGDKIALLGKNGVGKSSLIKVLTGELEASSGKVGRAHNLEVGFFSQKREGLIDDMTPWELIGEGIDYVISNTGERKHVASYLESFLFSSEELKRPISTFSGGEKNRLQLAQFMKNAKDIWIFDEPTNDLDLETIGVLEEELRSYKGALIVIGHDREFIKNVSDKCWLIHDQNLEQFEGGYSQARDYMEALELEERLAKIQDKGPSSEKKTQVKVSYKDKERFKELPALIEKKEKQQGELEKNLESFDYNDLNEGKKKKLEDLQVNLKKCGVSLEKLYEEWAQLEEKLGS